MVRVFVDDGKRLKKSECEWKDIQLKQLDFEELRHKIKQEFRDTIPNIMDDSLNLRWTLVRFRDAASLLEERGKAGEIHSTESLEEETQDSSDESDSEEQRHRNSWQKA
ncbi:hypothetical protein RFI_07841 [Reticulomyxa filosa]|uniref:Uncharacterized protein n=1 Tax=Reticulomyxa filosa TaxID=46433 RepID=X6NTK0_RETFI|nr:hypothetical protein RFI_07841 [Reticulomyxa filosa]|eukprot:ETO29278.1 hypothetical protein RFI_07841 [Reticulomyxa filosa]